MISKVLEVKIKTLRQNEKWKIGGIAKELGIHPDVVKRVLGVSARPKFDDVNAALRVSVLDAWLPLIEKILEEHPQIKATRILDMLKSRGYSGSVYPIRNMCRMKRSSSNKAYLDLQFMPGEMAQVDWASFGSLQIGKHHRKVHAFVMVLAYSRRIYAHFFHDMCTTRVLEGHVLAFQAFGGSSREVLYDNMKTAVIENVGEGVRFQKDLLEIASHYAFIPRACNPRSGWEKGRVERAIRYIREGFFEGRKFENLIDLNAQMDVWLNSVTLNRKWTDDHTITVRDAFELERLCPLPSDSFDPYEERTVLVDKKAMVNFDTNCYPVNPDYAGGRLTLRATHSQIKIMTESETIHTYQRLWSKHETLRVPQHQEEIARKRKLKTHRVARSSLEKTLASGRNLMNCWAELDENIQQNARRVLELVTTYGVKNVEAAAQLAMENGTPRSCSIAHILAENHNISKSSDNFKLSQELSNVHIERKSTETYDELYQRGK